MHFYPDRPNPHHANAKPTTAPARPATGADVAAPDANAKPTTAPARPATSANVAAPATGTKPPAQMPWNMALASLTSRVTALESQVKALQATPTPAPAAAAPAAT